MDLRKLNKFLKIAKFRVVFLSSAIDFHALGMWFSILDLKDAHFYVAVHQLHRSFYGSDRALMGLLHFLPIQVAYGTWNIYQAYICANNCSIFPYLSN